MKKTILLLLIIISISCKNENDKNNTISANITGINSQISIILDSIDSNETNFRVDSIKVIDNEFKFIIPRSNTPKEYRITIFNDSLNQPITFIPFWFENEDITIAGNLNKLDELQIKGGKLNEIQNEFANIFKKYTPEIEKEMSSAKTQEESQSIFQKYVNLIELDQLSLIYKKPNNLISLSNIIRITNRVSQDSIQLYYNQLDDKLKSSKKGQIILEQSKITKLKIGNYVQDFTANDLEGNTVKLSDFKGKIILLDFWASWCVPCHQQNQKEFSELYEKYKNQNFVIISYSLDVKTAKEDWRKASLNDKISWINISNLRGFDDPLSKQYNISSVPNSFLIDQNGKIVNSFIGYDSENSTIESEIIKLIDKKTTHNN